MTITLYLYISIFTLLNVSAFYYKAIPVHVGPTKVSCPWSNPPTKGVCTLLEEGIGYYCPNSNTTFGLLNPLLQNCDIQKSVCLDPEKIKKLRPCVLNATCHTVSENNRVCTCGAGFFGDPYEKCYKQCEKDSDCNNAFAKCKSEGTNKLKRCVCKEGYHGDGVICEIDPCGRKQGQVKCPEPSVCVPKGPDSYACVCPKGYYKDLETNKCVEDIAVVPGKIISFTGFGLTDGTRVEAGECISFTFNTDGKSVFYHINSGDSIFVKKRIVLNPSFYVAFEVTSSNIVAFSLVDEDKSKLTKLYTVTNTTKDCKFGHIKLVFPSGESLLLDGSVNRNDVFVKANSRPLTEGAERRTEL